MYKILDKLPARTLAVGAIRWSLVFIFALFGIAKFAAYEAEGVARTAMHYPLFAWMYPLIGVQGTSNVIGTIELSTGVLIALGAWSHRAGLLGGLMGMATFCVTLSFSFGAALWEKGMVFRSWGLPRNSSSRTPFCLQLVWRLCFTPGMHCGKCRRLIGSWLRKRPFRRSRAGV